MKEVYYKEERDVHRYFLKSEYWRVLDPVWGYESDIDECNCELLFNDMIVADCIIDGKNPKEKTMTFWN
jgi:hypothetical protein